MRGDVVKMVVKAVNNGIMPRETLARFFLENADYSVAEEELEKAFINIQKLVDFVKENHIKPGRIIEYRVMGKLYYESFDGLFPDGKNLIVMNSTNYDVKRAAAKAGDVIIRVSPDFSVEVVEVIE